MIYYKCQKNSKIWIARLPDILQVNLSPSQFDGSILYFVRTKKSAERTKFLIEISDLLESERNKKILS